MLLLEVVATEAAGVPDHQDNAFQSVIFREAVLDLKDSEVVELLVLQQPSSALTLPPAQTDLTPLLALVLETCLGVSLLPVGESKAHRIQAQALGNSQMALLVRYETVHYRAYFAHLDTTPRSL